MIIAANWKAYVADLSTAKALARSAEKVSDADHRIILAPPAPMLGYLRDHTHARVMFAAQDISDSSGGAATGETTAPAAHASGASYAIIGHSERRAMGEDDARIARKVQLALGAGIMPILCVGERERDAEAEYLGVVRSQVAAVLEAIQPEERLRIIVAYEPVWAIGKSSQDAIVPGDLLEMVRYIRKTLETYLAPAEAKQIPILYGGSVEPANIRALADGTDIQGFLVGRASTEPKTFSALVRAIR
jgi:triosephosphate isomerase (TIM)